MSQVHRNDPCPCGSGKKYKKCCGQKKGFTQRKISVISNQSRSFSETVHSLGKELQEKESLFGKVHVTKSDRETEKSQEKD